MEDLQQAAEKICDLKGNLLAIETFMAALLAVLTTEQRAAFLKRLSAEAESCKAQLLGAAVSEITVEAFARDIQRVSTRCQSLNPR